LFLNEGSGKTKRDRELAALDLVNGRVEEKEGESQYFHDHQTFQDISSRLSDSLSRISRN